MYLPPHLEHLRHQPHLSCVQPRGWYDPNRGSGRTTQQMKNAPEGALFVCPVSFGVWWFANRANAAERGDLRVVKSDILTAARVHECIGYRYPAIIVDHAFRWGDEQARCWRRLQSCILP